MGRGNADCILEFPPNNPSSPFSGRIITSRLWKSGTGVTNDTFRLLIFQGTPSQNPNENAGPATSFIKEADIGLYIGQIDYEAGVVGADAVHYEGQDYIPSSGIPFVPRNQHGLIFGLLTAIGAYEPASAEVFTITLQIQD